MTVLFWFSSSQGGKIPVCAGTDAEVFLACARAAGIRNLAEVRACRVVNTLKVGEAWVSPALLAELKAREGKDDIRTEGRKDG